MKQSGDVGLKVRDALLDAMNKTRRFRETWEGFEEGTPDDAEELLDSMLTAVEDVLRENDDSAAYRHRIVQAGHIIRRLLAEPAEIVRGDRLAGERWLEGSETPPVEDTIEADEVVTEAVRFIERVENIWPHELQGLCPGLRQSVHFYNAKLLMKQQQAAAEKPAQFDLTGDEDDKNLLLRGTNLVLNSNYEIVDEED